MQNAIATAKFNDIWAGNVDAQVLAFKTTRRGERVTRYRWVRVDGQGCGYNAFPSVARAVAAVRLDRRFSDVTLTSA